MFTDLDRFGGAFDRFNFNDIPGFREHFPADWNHRFGSRDEPQPHAHATPHPQPQTSQSQPQQQTTATQTDQDLPDNVNNLPQYGLRNTVDLGQKSAADPSIVDAEERGQRSMSAPPDSRSHANMSGPTHRPEQNVRRIPIFVEGRDEPVISNVDSSAHFAETKPSVQPHVDRDEYFTNDTPTGIHHPPNMQKSFGSMRMPAQQPHPFSQKKMFPQSAARGESPHRTQTPHPPADQPPNEHPQHHHQPPPAEDRHPAQQPPASQPPPPPQNATPPKPQATPADPITLILAIQTDVLNLMTDVEKFTGTKKDKNYLYLDEMLTRNLIKLDLIETDGKENIRTARKEAIKCIQKCIAVLEAKAEKATREAKEKGEEKPNGEAEMKEETEKPEASVPPPQEGDAEQPQPQPQPEPAVEAEPQSDQSKPKEAGPRNKKPATKGPNARDKNKETEAMQVEETAQPLAEPMEQDVPSQ